MTTLTDRVLDALGPGLVARAGVGLAALVDGLAGGLRDADDRLAPTGRGWATAFDLDTTPEPKWIGTATGTTVPGGLTLAQQRTYVRDRPAFRRGTPTALVAAVAGVLTGTQRVELLERDGGPWRATVRVYAAELPGTTADVLAAALAHKPVGILLDVIELTGATYDHLTAYHGTYEALAATFPTYDAATPGATTLTYHVPEEGTDA